MDLFVSSVTLREVIGESCRFPKGLRELLCGVVGGITAEELAGLLSKHEADRGNFDARLEANLRELNPSLHIRANCRISDRTKFDNDIVIDTDDALICLEVEKGNMSRFEFDILKMQAFATHRKREAPGKPVFGAFVVPADNIVGRHISGNTRESSYRYLTRLCRLVGQIETLGLEDILLIGYALTEPQGRTRRSPPRDKRAKPAKETGKLLVEQNGLLPDEALRDGLRGYPTDLIFHLRSRLAEACLTLREKFNPNSRYLGYGLPDGSDDLYVYVQKRGLVIDIRLPADRAGELRRLGFQVRPRDNYQAKAGWLTGLFVPHDTDKRQEAVALALEALRGE